MKTLGSRLLPLLALLLGGCDPALPDAYVQRLSDALELPSLAFRPRQLGPGLLRQAPVPEEKGDMLIFWPSSAVAWAPFWARGTAPWGG